MTSHTNQQLFTVTAIFNLCICAILIWIRICHLYSNQLPIFILPFATRVSFTPYFFKEEPVPELFPQMLVSGYSWPRRWRIRLSLHLVLGLPCRLVHSRGVHSVTLFVHLLSLNRAMCPAHPCIPFLITSMISFTPVLCRIQVLRLWSRRVMLSLIIYNNILY